MKQTLFHRLRWDEMKSNDRLLNNATKICKSDDSECKDDSGFGWDEFWGLYRGARIEASEAKREVKDVSKIDTRKLYFLRLNRIEKDESDIIKKAITQGSTDTIFFDEHGHITVNTNGGYTEARNPLFLEINPSTNQEANDPFYYTKNIEKEASSYQRWKVNYKILFNRQLTYFIKYDEVKKQYNLYYNPMHRKGFRDFHLDPNQAVDYKDAIIRDYCASTTTLGLTEKGSMWGDPTCGCVSSWNIRGNEFGSTNDIFAKTRAWTDIANSDDITTTPYWPYNILSEGSNTTEEKETQNKHFNSLANYINQQSAGNGLLDIAHCNSPACKIEDVGNLKITDKVDGLETPYRSFYNNLGFEICSDSQSFTLQNCQIQQDSAGDNNLSGNTFNCILNGGSNDGTITIDKEDDKVDDKEDDKVDDKVDDKEGNNTIIFLILGLILFLLTGGVIIVLFL